MKSDIVAIAWRELKQHKRRTLAVISGYALIVAFLIVLAAVLFYSRVVQNITIGEAGTYFVTWLPACGDISSLSEEDLARLARGIIPEVCKEQCENCTGCNKKPFDIINEGFVINTNGTRLLSFEIVEKIAALPVVKDASACLMFRFRDPQTNSIFAVGGIDPRSSAVSTNCCAASDLVAGTFLDGSQVGRVLVDVGFAGNHGLKCGSRLVIASETFEVAGIINSGARPVKPDVIMLFAEAERVINRRIHNPLAREANLVLIESLDATVHGKALEDVKAVMKSDSLLTTGCYFPAAKAIGLNTSLVRAFMILVAAAAMLFSARIQWASALERRRSFAILKAIGWSNRVIVLQQIAEALIQSVIGSAVGLVAGLMILILLPVNELLGIDATMTGAVNPVICFSVIAFAIAAGLLAGILPVLLVVRQRPADILRRI